MGQDMVLDAKAPPESRKHRINTVLAATLVAGGLSWEEAAQQCGAKNGETLRVMCYKKGVTARQARSVTAEHIVSKSVTLRLANEAGKLLKDSMAGILQSHTDALSKIPAKPNLKHIQSVGAALEPLVRSAKVVHGWGDEAAQGLIIDVRQADPDAANVVTEVAATVTPMVAGGTSEQNCGIADTTGSGVVEQAELQKPQ